MKPQKCFETILLTQAELENIVVGALTTNPDSPYFGRRFRGASLFLPLREGYALAVTVPIAHDEEERDVSVFLDD